MIACKVQPSTEASEWRFIVCTMFVQESVYNFRLDVNLARLPEDL